MIPAFVPIATQIAADFGVGWIVHGGVKMATCMTQLNTAQKVCIGADKTNCKTSGTSTPGKNK